MKKIISLILVALFAFTALSMTACGSINSNEVSILWSDDGVVKVPDSLINCIERAMYIENISYRHYGANGDEDAQLEQAKAAVEAGCAALVIELVDSDTADKFVDIAKPKNIPLIFIGNVEESVLESYEKCAAIGSDDKSLAKVRAEQIGKYVVDNLEALDRNGNGKLSYIHFSSGNSEDLMEEINKIAVDADGKPLLEFYDLQNTLKLLPELGAGLAYREIMKKYNDDSHNAVELIITDNDATAREVLEILQKNGFNTDKLTTHCIPVFTVGFEEDYKNYVLSGIPEIEDKYVILPTDSVETLKEKMAKYEEAIAKHYDDNKYLCDLTAVSEEDVDKMIWNTKNVIASGRIAGTVIEDQDALAAAIAATVRNFVKDNGAFDGLKEECVSGKQYLIPYIPN